MTRLDALRALLTQVEAGTWPADFLAIDNGIHGITTATMYAAFSGSLDAAKALHEAVLPGWEFQINSIGEAIIGSPRKVTDSADSIIEDSPARAWLACIIQALIKEAGE